MIQVLHINNISVHIWKGEQEQIVNMQFEIPLPEEVTCQNRGTYVTDFTVKCQISGTCERMNSHICMCPDGMKEYPCEQI